jgi:hypothetical protein
MATTVATRKKQNLAVPGGGASGVTSSINVQKHFL